MRRALSRRVAVVKGPCVHLAFSQAQTKPSRGNTYQIVPPPIAIAFVLFLLLFLPGVVASSWHRNNSKTNFFFLFFFSKFRCQLIRCFLFFYFFVKAKHNAAISESQKRLLTVSYWPIYPASACPSFRIIFIFFPTSGIIVFVLFYQLRLVVSCCECCDIVTSIVVSLIVVTRFFHPLPTDDFRSVGRLQTTRKKNNLIEEEEEEKRRRNEGRRRP